MIEYADPTGQGWHGTDDRIRKSLPVDGGLI